MAYTRKDSPQKINGGQPATFLGGVINDANRVSLDRTSGINTNDGAASPVISPVAVAAGVNTILTVPPTAVSVTLMPSAALNISELAAFTQYATIPANSSTTISLTRQKFLYLQGAATVSFFFNLID